MAKEICISSTPHETRLAILEDDQLAEIYYERENEYTLAGSIYNGRVTRVLPGMQSAFVDVGLERDAFLYVTDFLELEDQEETDELEKAAASGGNQPPREVRHAAADSNAGRGEGRNGRAGQRTEQNQEPRTVQERPAAGKPAPGRRIVVEASPEAGEVTRSESAFDTDQDSNGQRDAVHGDAGPDATGQEDSSLPGAKRWRGRRRRRGSRTAVGSAEEQKESGGVSGAFSEEISGTEPEVAPEIHAAAAVSGERFSQPERSAGSKSRFEAAPAPTPFVLPGESLSKYGGAAAGGESAESGPKSAKAAPLRPANTFKPATLIDSPIEWDGSGLLPGESLAKRGNRQSEPVLKAGSKPEAGFSDAQEAGDRAPDAIEEQDFFEETITARPEALAAEVEQNPEAEEERVEEETTAETNEGSAEAAPEPLPAEAEPQVAVPASADDYATKTLIEAPSAEEPVASPLIRQDEVLAEDAHEAQGSAASDSASATEKTTEAPETEPDASASHNVAPIAPTGFRLFGLGGKKKAAEEAPEPAAEQAFVPSVSAFAPGSGLIEEEVIEGEEFDAPRHSLHHGRGGDQNMDNLEEETLPNQIPGGDLGEMLKEADLDRRIQLEFDAKNGDEEGFEDEEDEDEQPVAETGAPSQQHRDRSARGRRGRGGAAAPAAQTGRGRGPSRRSAQLSDLPIISDLLKPGQEILVQIAKEPIAKKGARITSHIALPGRFLVFMPTVTHVGVSRKIASDEERQRLKRILVHERGEASGGFIVRTAAEGASEEDLRADLRFLLHLWAEIKERSDTSKSPALIYHDLSLIERILRDQVSSNFSSIWVDSEADYERIVRFLNRFSPTLVRRVKLYTKETPLFEHFGIQDEISKALRSKVWLKSGGSIVINQTEALVAIDINTGKYVGKSARLEDTIVKTNLDAVPEIVRQIRLRDLGGIIVIDFIDMDDRKNRFRVMAALEEALKSDRAPTKVLQFNDFGLVAITRKRVKQSLERTLSVPCPTCQATGMVKSPATVCNEIYTELRKMKKHFEGSDVLLRVNPETVKVLKSNNGSWLTEFEELVGKNILVKSDATLHPEQFDIQG
jgi:ribonuclease G